MKTIDLQELDNTVINMDSIKKASCLIEIEENGDIETFDELYEYRNVKDPIFLKFWNNTIDLDSDELEMCCVYSKSDNGKAYFVVDKFEMTSVHTIEKEEGPLSVVLIINEKFMILYSCINDKLSIPHPDESQWYYMDEKCGEQTIYDDQYIAHHNYNANKIVEELSLNETIKKAKNVTKKENFLEIKNNDDYFKTDFSKMGHLETIKIKDCDIEKINQAVLYLNNLKQLNISSNSYTDLKGLNTIENLEELNISDNNLTEIPKEIFEFQNLKILHINKNKITILPDEIKSLLNLTELNISNNRLSKISENIGSLKHLKRLNVKGNYINSLPESICQLKLEFLCLEKNKGLKENYPNCLEKMDDFLPPKEDEIRFSSYLAQELYGKIKSLDDDESEEAFEYYNKILELEKNGSCYYGRGYCYIRKKQYDDALKDFSDAIELDGEKRKYLEVKAVVHNWKGENQKALEYITKAIDQTPTAQSLGNRALIYKAMGEYQKALIDCTKALDHTGVWEVKCELYVSRAGFYRRLALYDEMFDDLNHALKCDPKNISVYLDTIGSYIRVQEYNKAKDFFTKYEKKIIKISNKRDKLLFYYLKAIISICHNVSFEDLEKKIKPLLKNKMKLRWSFPHTRDSIKNSNLNQGQKNKIGELTDLLESIDLV
ncbi:MAG: tetratricopeptide repeat protein [Desulfobacterales bacterium]|nr:tetratricopeptide repeat protein [Desulfobacterales bacterium]